MRRPNLVDLPELPPLPAGYTLREYRLEDRGPLAATLQNAFPDYVWTPEKVQEALVDAPDVKKILVVDAGGLPVATASARLAPDVHPGSGYVHWVAVDPAHQGQKLGYFVTLAVLHEFVQMGCNDAVLETDDHRLAAIKTYQNLGFVPEYREDSDLQRWMKIAANLLAAANL